MSWKPWQRTVCWCFSKFPQISTPSELWEVSVFVPSWFYTVKYTSSGFRVCIPTQMSKKQAGSSFMLLSALCMCLPVQNFLGFLSLEFRHRLSRHILATLLWQPSSLWLCYVSCTVRSWSLSHFSVVLICLYYLIYLEHSEAFQSHCCPLTPFQTSLFMSLSFWISSFWHALPMP